VNRRKTKATHWFLKEADERLERLAELLAKAWQPGFDANNHENAHDDVWELLEHVLIDKHHCIKVVNALLELAHKSDAELQGKAAGVAMRIIEDRNLRFPLKASEAYR
jgi:hypothetical protein